MLKSKLPYERREFGRRRATVSAQVKLADLTTLDCTVHNVSEGGALIELREAADLPRRFGLCIDGGLTLACETRHREGTRVGVEFTVALMPVTVESAAILDLVAFARQAPWGQDTF